MFDLARCRIRTALLLTAGAFAVASMDANGQVRMPQRPPTRQSDPMPRELLLTQDQWINSLVDRWSTSQRRSWLSLDRTFRAWVSRLVWTTKNAGRLSSDEYGKRSRFQLPVGCGVEPFVAPDQSFEDSMNYFREVLPEVNWSAWNNIDAKFRGVAEWELAALHAKAQRSTALRVWWELNDQRVRECFDLASTKPRANARNEQIERREKSEREAADHAVAPEPIKLQAQQQIRDAAAVEKYVADLDRQN